MSGRNGATLPNFDLGGAEDVTPYTYNPAGPNGTGAPAADDGMRQHSNVPAFLAGGLAGAGAGAGAAAAHRPGSVSPPVTSAPSHYSQSHYAPSSSDPSQYPDYSAYNQYAQQPGAGVGSNYNQPGGFAPEFRQPSPGPSMAYSSVSPTSPTHSGSGSGAPFMGAAGALQSNKDREAMMRRSGMQLANPGEVVQHQDGGRVPEAHEEEENVLNEVPPRYDQIHRDA